MFARAGTLAMHDIRLQWCYGIFPAYSFMLALYVGVMVWAGPHLPAWAPAVIIFTDPAALGFFFLGALIMLERAERVTSALAVAPLAPADDFIAKCGTLTAVALMCLVSDEAVVPVERTRPIAGRTSGPSAPTAGSLATAKVTAVAAIPKRTTPLIDPADIVGLLRVLKIVAVQDFSPDRVEAAGRVRHLVTGLAAIPLELRPLPTTGQFRVGIGFVYIAHHLSRLGRGNCATARGYREHSNSDKAPKHCPAHPSG